MNLFPPAQTNAVQERTMFFILDGSAMFVPQGKGTS
jgi:hypothetical protein